MALTAAVRTTETAEAIIADRGCPVHVINSHDGIRRWSIGSGLWMAEIPSSGRRILATFDRPTPPTPRDALVAMVRYMAASGA